MPASSPLVIATNAVTRLLKERDYYGKDYKTQQQQIQTAKSQGTAGEDGENAEYLLKQRETALAETETVLKQMPGTIRAAKDKLENTLASKSDWPSSEVEKAKEAIASASASS